MTMRDTLKLFIENNNLEYASGELLKKLGVKYTPIVEGVPFDSYFEQMDFSYQYLEEAKQCVEHIWNIGYINDTTFQQDANNSRYDSLSIFACEIRPDANFTRGLAVDLTRAFNRVSTRNVNNYYDMPVIVIMKQGTLLSIATCEHSDRKDGMGDKVGKVTILRNMNCENLHAGHRQILERIAKDVSGCSSYEKLHKKWFESFSIDILSDKFFAGYKAIYEDIIEYVTGKRMVKKGSKWTERDNHNPCIEIMNEFRGFPNPEKAVRDYVKNLMGRLVFIQFLQKKGWMGVPAGDAWEGGDPEFLQHLFDNSDKKETFIDDVLEPLYNDLNTKRHADLVTNQNIGENIKVPYLNGGLFELDASDDTTFALPSKYMKKMLDFFASYNFTIDENAPDDVEIGVDPEMLGRIFENLLEDNKEKGAFYTPKEIVRYMCRESLIAYLTTCIMKKQGDNHQPEDKIQKAVRQLLLEPEEIIPKMTPEHLEDFGRYIRDVKICDPAVGSGAFPMGILNELVRCRVLINAWAKDSYGNLLIGDMAALKAEIICNNIYGVDIEKGAIDIARLRFWLSIIVDAETPHALPNFDYKFMVGNSLIPTFAGQYINLSTKDQKHIKVDKMIELKKQILKYKRDFYTSSGEEKQKLNILIKDHILQLISQQLCYEIKSWAQAHADQLSLDIINTQDIKVKDTISQLPEEKKRVVELGKSLREQLADKCISLEKRSQIDILFFDWSMMFTEVFDVEDGDGGFDIVIGNPPFIQLQANEGLLARLYQDKGYESYARTGDIYCLFYEQGWQLLKNGGNLCYITSNKWMRAVYGKKIRDFFVKKTDPTLLIDFGKVKIFDSATVDTNILMFKKGTNHHRTFCAVTNEQNKDGVRNLSVFVQQHRSICDFTSSDSWVILSEMEQSILRKIQAIGTPLKEWKIKINYGIKTGNTDAFIVTTEKRDEILANCSNDDERNRTSELIRPLLRGRDIKRYGYEWANLWLISTFPSCHYDIEHYPAVKNHLLSFAKQQLIDAGYSWVVENHLADYCKQKLSQTGRFIEINGRRISFGDGQEKARKRTGNKWFETQDSINYWKELFKPRIVYREISDEMEACLIDSGLMINNKLYMISGDNLDHLIHFFNSRLFNHFLLQHANVTGGKGKDFMLDIKVPLPSECHINKEDADYNLYKYYKLTENEISYIENVKKSHKKK